jgi:hypothetical protein
MEWQSYENTYEVQLIVTSYEKEIVAAEARERSELEPGIQMNTGDRPVRVSSVILRFYLYVIFGVIWSASSCVLIALPGED